MPKDYLSKSDGQEKGIVLSRMNIEVLDDGSFLCEKYYKRREKKNQTTEQPMVDFVPSRKSSHESPADLVAYLRRVLS